MIKVVGGGLIAKSFVNWNCSKDCVIIASGVSNSQETKPSEFERESALIIESIRSNPDSRVVYFSTTSVFQAEKTAYVKHKLEMEKLVEATSPSFNIFRLPQIVGLVKNTTLISFLVNNISQGKRISLQKNAERSLLDISDLVRLTKLFIENNLAPNTTVTLSGGDNVAVLDIVKEISKILHKEALFDLMDNGHRYTADIELLHKYVEESDPIFSPDYWKFVLNKYVPQLLLQEDKF